jgi:hypothetical protein
MVRYRTAEYLSTRTTVRRLDICLLTRHASNSSYIPYIWIFAYPDFKDMDTKCPNISPEDQLHGLQNNRIFDFQNSNSSDTGCPDILAIQTGCLDTPKGLPRPCHTRLHKATEGLILHHLSMRQWHSRHCPLSSYLRLFLYTASLY